MVTIKELRKSANSKRRDFLYSLMDYLAYYPAKLFLYTSLTANQITVIWIIGQIIAALFLTTGDYLTIIIALIAFQAMFILDCTDGIVARYKKQFSLNGVYLDYLGHYITNPLLFICLGIGITKYTHNIIYLFIGLFTALLFLLNKAITLNPLWYDDPKQKEIITQSSKKSLLKNQKGLFSLLFTFFRLEYLFNAMFWGVLLGYANYILIIYFILFLFEFLRKSFSQFIGNNNLS